MLYHDKQDAITEHGNQGGWLIYYPAMSDAPQAWEHTIDEGYIRDLYRDSGSPQSFEAWADELTAIAKDA